MSDQYKKTWQGSRVVKFQNLKSFSWLRSIDKRNLKYSFFRFDKFKRIKIFEGGGWHFSYLMTEKEIQKKIKAWTHAELDTEENNSLEVIKDRVKSNKDLFGRDITLSKIEFTRIFTTTSIRFTFTTFTFTLFCAIRTLMCSISFFHSVT